LVPHFVDEPLHNHFVLLFIHLTIIAQVYELC
jgi:hypothetical protein